MQYCQEVKYPPNPIIFLPTMNRPSSFIKVPPFIRDLRVQTHLEKFKQEPICSLRLERLSHFSLRCVPTPPNTNIKRAVSLKLAKIGVFLILS